MHTGPHERDTNSVDERSSAETADYRDRLHAAAEASTNWAGSIVGDDRREVVIYGVGTPTEELATVIAEAPSTLRASEDPTGALNARFPVTIEYGGRAISSA